MSAQNLKSSKSSIMVYLLLANGITWLGWIPGLVIGAQQGFEMPNFNTYPSLFKNGYANSQHMMLAIAFYLGVYGPLIGSLVATRMDRGRRGLTDLWRRITKWRIGGRWYLIALVITLLLAGFPVLVFSLAGGFKPSAFAFSYVLLFFVIQLFTSGLGEEPGWRGFLLPRLQSLYHGDKFVWVLGLIWAIWHYPLVISQVMFNMQNLTVPQMVITIVMALAGQTMTLIGIAFIYVWLYNQTQSIFLMIVFHALSNTFSNWFSSFLAAPETATLFIALMPWVVVVFLQKRLGKEWFLGKPHPEGELTFSD